jgi:hypothetical protein
MSEGGSIHRLTYKLLVPPNVGIIPNLLEPLLFGRSMRTVFVSPPFNVTGLDLSCPGLVKSSQRKVKLIGSLP